MALNVKGTQKAAASKPFQESTDFSQHLQSKPIKAAVSTEKKVAGEEWGGAQGETEVVVPGTFESNGMEVTIEGGSTINLGNYESARIGVSIKVPCSPSTLNEAYEWGLSWVGERITSEVKKAKGL